MIGPSWHQHGSICAPTCGHHTTAAAGSAGEKTEAGHDHSDRCCHSDDPSHAGLDSELHCVEACGGESHQHRDSTQDDSPVSTLPAFGMLVQSDDSVDDCSVCRFYSTAQLQSMQVACVATSLQGSPLVTLPSQLDSALDYPWFARGPPVAG